MSISQDWCHQNFAGVPLSDKRRVKRVLTIASALAESPGCSFPQLFEKPYDVKATYNLFKHPEVTPESLQARHREMVMHQLSEPETTLLLEDTTEMSWEGRSESEDLGPVGPGSTRHKGFLLHSVLAVRWVGNPNSSSRPPLEIIGIADQQYHIRKPAPEGDDERWRGKLTRPRESNLWEEAGKHLGPVTGNARWVRICDRGADIYEFLRSCQELEHGFVVRAAYNRGLVPSGQLFGRARETQACGKFKLHLRARPGHPSRTAELSVSACRVSLRAPQRPGHATGKLPPFDCTVLRAWEMNPPEGCEPLEWILLTDDPAEDFETALVCVLQYATRWVIEEFHKALKTGLGAERLQLETAHRLFAAISIMSVVALRLLDLKERTRVSSEAPATEAGLDGFELKVLAMKLSRKLETVRDVALAIGRLGGHMNRKGDGMPGMLTLWKGMIKLQALVAGARLGLQIRNLGKD